MAEVMRSTMMRMPPGMPASVSVKVRGEDLVEEGGDVVKEADVDGKG